MHIYIFTTTFILSCYFHIASLFLDTPDIIKLYLDSNAPLSVLISSFLSWDFLFSLASMVHDRPIRLGDSSSMVRVDANSPGCIANLFVFVSRWAEQQDSIENDHLYFRVENKGVTTTKVSVMWVLKQEWKTCLWNCKKKQSLWFMTKMNAFRLEIFSAKISSTKSRRANFSRLRHMVTHWAPWLLMFQLANMFRNGLAMVEEWWTFFLNWAGDFIGHPPCTDSPKCEEWHFKQ